MEADIRQKLAKDFGPNLPAALAAIAEFDAKEKDPPSDRLVRAIVYLAAGDLEGLRQSIELAQIDYRDVLWQAEYDGGEILLRNFNRTFGDLGL